MGAAQVLDKEINYYLGHLNTHQKEVVLSVIKTFANEEDAWWDTAEELAKESIKRGLQQAKDGDVLPHGLQSSSKAINPHAPSEQYLRGRGCL